MKLLDLPGELLAKILNELDGRNQLGYANNGKPHLCAVSLTCSTLASIARSALTNNIKFEINCSTAIDIQRVKLFSRTCHESRSVLRVYKAEISWLLNQPEKEEALRIYDEFLQNISAAVFVLKVELNLGWSSSAPRYEYKPNYKPWKLPTLLQTGHFPNVRSLKLDLPIVYADQLVRLLQWPSLEHLTLRTALDDAKASVSFDTNRSHLPASDLTKLSCCWRPVQFKALHQALLICPRLRVLSFPLPGPAEEIDRKTFIGASTSSSLPGFNLHHGVQVREIQRMLVPVQTHLTKLNIDGDNVEWDHHDRYRLNLTTFARLRKVRLDSAIILGDNPGPSESRRGLWQLLPRSLEKLVVTFAAQSSYGLFTTVKQMREKPIRTTFDRVWRDKESQMNWLEELAEHKERAFPLLWKIKVISDGPTDLKADWKVVEWDISESIMARFQSKGIRLTGELLVPKQWQAPTNTLYTAEVPDTC